MLDDVILLFCGIAVTFYGYAIYSAWRFFSPSTLPPRHKPDVVLPPVTIFKPLCGLDSQAYLNLSSFCQLDYPTYQILFGVRDSADPSIPLVQKLIRDFPNCDARLIVNDRIIGSNLKVSNLSNLEPFAKYDLFLMSDSDIRVTPDFLQRIMQPFNHAQTGVVTCLYRSQVKTAIATLEALAIATDFHAGVLVAQQLGWMKFAMGSSILIRRHVLQDIGGFQAIADYLADDFMMGHLPSKQGYRVVLSDYVVDHILDTATLIDFVQHQTRWNRCTRSANPGGYWGLIFTQGVTFSTLFCLLQQGSPLGWMVLGSVWGLRYLMAWIIGAHYLKDPVARKWLFWVPFRDLLSSALWAYGLIGNHVTWRGQQFRLVADGKLVPINPPTPTAQTSHSTP